MGWHTLKKGALELRSSWALTEPIGVDPREKKVLEA
jgi:hypothetical protein